MYPDTIAPHVSQCERFALAPIAPPHDDDEPLCVTISSPPNGFVMPSMQAVRDNDARCTLHAPRSSAFADDGDDDEQDDEQELREQVAYKRRDSMREHSFRLPSQGSRADLRDTFRSMNMAWHD